MKIKFTCLECFGENRKTIDFIQVQDESLYYYACSQGHKNVYFEKNEKFELLMQSAVYAILDGYYREAVSSMSASLERLQEFAIKVLCKESEVSDELFKLTWKVVNPQSERQLGAFVFLYTQKYKSIPDILDNNDRNFRNDIIHKGKFPTYDETIKYGQRILDITFNILSNLRSTSEQTIRNLEDQKQEEIFSKFEEIKEDPSTNLSPNILNLYDHISSFEKPNLVEYLKLAKAEHSKKSTNA
jgi:hypothetical protein